MINSKLIQIPSKVDNIVLIKILVMKIIDNNII